MEKLLKERDKYIDEMDVLFERAFAKSVEAKKAERDYVVKQFSKYGIEVGINGTHVKYKKTGEIGVLQWCVSSVDTLGDLYNNCIRAKYRDRTTLADGLRYCEVDFYPLTKKGVPGARKTKDTSYRYNKTIGQFMEYFEVVKENDV